LATLNQQVRAASSANVVVDSSKSRLDKIGDGFSRWQEARKSTFDRALDFHFLGLAVIRQRSEPIAPPPVSR
jgi:hypothetical protein